MTKLHSLIDHLKDQEKGYMDLLNSFIKFQQLAGNYVENANGPNATLATATASEYSETSEGESNANNANDFAIHKYQKDILDLSELNESIYQQQQLQQQLQQRLAESSQLAALNNSRSKSSQLETSLRSNNSFSIKSKKIIFLYWLKKHKDTFFFLLQVKRVYTKQPKIQQQARFVAVS